MCEGEVHAVRVHLDEFEVSPVEVVVEELVVELEHAKLGKLVDHDANLEGAVDDDLALAHLDLVRVTDLFKIIEPGRAKMFVDLIFIPCVQGSLLPLHPLDELAVSAVSQELEDLREQGLLLVCVALSPIVSHLLHEPLEDLARLVVDGSIDRGELEPVVEVPLQVGAYRRIFVADKTPKSFCCSGKRFRQLFAGSRACAAGPSCRARCS